MTIITERNQRCGLIDVDKDTAMHPDKSGWVQSFGQLADRDPMHHHALVGVKFNIIAGSPHPQHIFE